MKALYIAYYTALRNMRDYTNLTIMLIFPIVMIFILGSALSGSFTIENMEPINVLLVNEDKGEISQSFEAFLHSNDIKEILNTEYAESYDEGYSKVKQGEAAALIHVKEGFDGQIDIYENNSSIFKSSVVKNVIDVFIQSANAQYAVQKLSSTSHGVQFSDNITEEAVNLDGSKPSSLDYYAVSMLLMTLMYGTTYGSSSMSEEQYHKTEIRLKSAPVEPYQIYAGKVAGTVLALMMDSVLIIVFTKYVYGVNWGGNIAAILFTCLTLAVLAAGIGTAGFMLIGDENKTQALLMVLVPIFTFLGGGYVPMQHLPPAIKNLSFISPNHLTQNIIFNIIYDGNSTQIINNLLILWGASAVLFALSAVKGRRLLT